MNLKSFMSCRNQPTIRYLKRTLAMNFLPRTLLIKPGWQNFHLCTSRESTSFLFPPWGSLIHLSSGRIFLEKLQRQQSKVFIINELQLLYQKYMQANGISHKGTLTIKYSFIRQLQQKSVPQ